MVISNSILKFEVLENLNSSKNNKHVFGTYFIVVFTAETRELS